MDEITKFRLTGQNLHYVYIALCFIFVAFSGFDLFHVSLFPQQLKEAPLFWWNTSNQAVMGYMFGTLVVLAIIARGPVGRIRYAVPVFVGVGLFVVVAGVMLNTLTGVAVYPDRVHRVTADIGGFHTEERRLEETQAVYIYCGVESMRGNTYVDIGYDIRFGDEDIVSMSEGIKGEIDYTRWFTAVQHVDKAIMATGADRIYKEGYSKKKVAPCLERLKRENKDIDGAELDRVFSPTSEFFRPR